MPKRKGKHWRRRQMIKIKRICRQYYKVESRRVIEAVVDSWRSAEAAGEVVRTPTGYKLKLGVFGGSGHAYIQGTCIEEYLRMAEKLADCLSTPSTSAWTTTVASLKTDMTFLENSFRANGLEIPRGKSYEDITREIAWNKELEQRLKEIRQDPIGSSVDWRKIRRTKPKDQS